MRIKLMLSLIFYFWLFSVSTVSALTIITDSEVSNNYHGIYLFSSSNNTITNNNVTQTWVNHPAKTALLIHSADEYFPRIKDYEIAYQWNNTVYHPVLIIETCRFISPTKIKCSWSLDEEFADGTFRIVKTAKYLKWVGFSTSGTNPFPLPMYMFFYYAYIPNKFLKNSFSIGDSWSEVGTFVGQAYSATTYVVGEESVSIGSGTFSCVKLKTEFSSTSSYINGTRYIWACKGCWNCKALILSFRWLFNPWRADNSCTPCLCSR